jgi:hypothetical protein
VIGAVVGALVVVVPFAIRDLAPPHSAFRLLFLLTTWFLVPPVLLLNEARAAVPDLFDHRLLRLAAYALANAVLYAGAACWLQWTKRRSILFRFAPLVLVPLWVLAFVVVRATHDF